MFLLDADVADQSFLGAPGAGLGYANGGAGCGIKAGFLGIDIDTFGSFGSNTTANSGFLFSGPGIGIRGAGNRTSPCTSNTGEYAAIGGISTDTYTGLPGDRTDPSTIPNYQYRRVRLSIDPKGSDTIVSLSLSDIAVAPALPTTFTPILSNITYTNKTPNNLYIGFAASTGNYSDFHDINNVKITAVSDASISMSVDTTNNAPTGLGGAYQAGDTIDFEIVATNNGPSTIGYMTETGHEAVIYADLSSLPLSNISLVSCTTSNDLTASCATPTDNLSTNSNIIQPWNGASGDKITLLLRATVVDGSKGLGLITGGNVIIPTEVPLPFDPLNPPNISPDSNLIQLDYGLSDSNIDNNSTPVSFTVGNPMFSNLTKTVTTPTVISIGDDIGYQITLENSGNSFGTATITDDLSEIGVDYSNAVYTCVVTTGTGSCTNTTNSVTSGLISEAVTLDPNSTATIEITGIKANRVGAIDSTVNIDADPTFGLIGCDTTICTDGTTSVNASTITVNNPFFSNLTKVEYPASPNSTVSGGIIRYTITLTNSGLGTGTARITDDLTVTGPLVDLSGATYTCEITRGTGSCASGLGPTPTTGLINEAVTLDPDSDVTLIIDLKATLTTVKDNTLPNTVDISSDPTFGVPGCTVALCTNGITSVDSGVIAVNPPYYTHDLSNQILNSDGGSVTDNITGGGLNTLDPNVFLTNWTSNPTGVGSVISGTPTGITFGTAFVTYTFPPNTSALSSIIWTSSPSDPNIGRVIVSKIATGAGTITAGNTQTGSTPTSAGGTTSTLTPTLTGTGLDDPAIIAAISSASWSCTGGSCAGTPINTITASGTSADNGVTLPLTLSGLPANDSFSADAVWTTSVNINGSSVSFTVTVPKDSSTNPPQFSLTKVISPAAPEIVYVGSQVVYTITLSNAAGAGIGDMDVADTVPSSVTITGFSCDATGATGATCSTDAPIGQDLLGHALAVPAGGIVTFTITGNVNSTVPLNNTANIQLPSPSSPNSPGCDTDITICTDAGGGSGTTPTVPTPSPATNAPQFDVVKTLSPAAPYIGSTVTYTITVTNNGVDAGDFDVIDDIVADVTNIDISKPCDISAAAGATCTVDPLVGTTYTAHATNVSAGGVVVFTITATAGTGDVSNSVVITPTDPGCTPISICIDGGGDGSGSTGVTPIIPEPITNAPQLSITKTADHTVYAVGQTIVYTITVSNSGGSAGTVTMTDSVPDVVTLDSANGVTCDIDPNNATTNSTCSVDSITGNDIVGTATVQPNESVIYTLTGIVNTIGDVTNIAIIDPTPTPGCTPTTICIEGGGDGSGSTGGPDGTGEPSFIGPFFEVTKVADQSSYVVGQDITYTITVKNTGMASGTATISDPVPTAVTVNDVTCVPSSANATTDSTCTVDAIGQTVIGTVDVQPNESVIYTIIGVVSAEGDVSNTAYSTPDMPECIISEGCGSGSGSTDGDPDTGEIIAGPAPKMTLSVNVTDSTGSPVERTNLRMNDLENTRSDSRILTFNYLLSNVGDVDIFNVEITMDEANSTAAGSMSVVNCPSTTLAVGTDMECTSTYAETPEDMAAGTYTIVTMANGSAVDNPEAEVVASVTDSAVISTESTEPPTIKPIPATNLLALISLITMLMFVATTRRKYLYLINKK